MSSPKFVAWKLPSSESRFNYSERNELGHPTLRVETYTSLAGACECRTNQFEYASNNIDLTRHVQLIGSTIRQVRSNVFNAGHRITTNFNALNEATAYTYNAKQQPTSVTTAGGLTTTNLYESSGTWSNFMTQRIQIEIKNTNTISYSNGLVFTLTNAAGLATTRTHDLLGRPLSVLYPDGTSENYSYTKLDLTKVLDRLGYTNSFIYNGFRQRTQSVDANSGTTTYSYCNCGSLDSITDPANKTTSYVYDQAGRQSATQFPGGYAVTNKYDLMGLVTNTADSASYNVTNWFNNQGMVCLVSNALGCAHSTKYDVEDHVTQTIDANNVTTKFAYDDLGRRTFITNALGTIASFRYSTVGLLAQTNQMTNWMGYAYDAAGRKTAETNANSEVTLFKYDASGSLTNLIDAKGNNTFWKFDQYGRMTNKTDAAGNVIFTYAYDANGRLTNRWTPAKGNTAGLRQQVR